MHAGELPGGGRYQFAPRRGAGSVAIMDFSGKQIGAPLPGVVVAHSAAQTQQYLGSPSLLDLGGERLMASHDEFGPGSTEHTCARTRLFFSADGGAT